MNIVNKHTNLPRPLSPQTKDRNVKQKLDKNAVLSLALTGIEGGVLNSENKSKIYT